MNAEIKAVIDVGTNSVKLLLAEVSAGTVMPILDTTAKTPARLGVGLYRSQFLQGEAMDAAVIAIEELLERTAGYRPESVRLVATSAVRDARNRSDFEALVFERTGLTLEVISGEREAELVHRGVTSDPEITGQSFIILDVGGGSTEIIMSSAGRVRFRHSFQLGTVRLMEMLGLSDPPTAGDRGRCAKFLEQFFRESIVPAVRSGEESAWPNFQLVATGGTAICLASMQAGGRLKDGIIPILRIARSDIHFQAERLWQLSVNERQLIPGLPRKRADVILTGAAIFDAALRYLDFDALTVSRRGLRYGVLAGDASRMAFAGPFRESSLYGHDAVPSAAVLVRDNSRPIFAETQMVQGTRSFLTEDTSAFLE